jgi:hypothetical protein
VAADAVDLADRCARAEQGGGQRLLVRQRQPVARQAGERPGAAAEQDEHEIAPRREQALGRRDAGGVGDRVAGMKQRDPFEPGLDTMRHDGDPGRVRITGLGDPRHLAGSLADRKHQRPLDVRQMRRQHIARVAGVDPGLKHLGEMGPYRGLVVGQAGR